LFAGLYEELCQLDDRIQAMEERIDDTFRADEACQRISRVEGIGPVIATAIVEAIANGRAFCNRRQISDWLGLVPRQYSSGDKQRLLGISKRADPYLRTLLIHGARFVYRSIPT
jgi:transposase